MILPDVNVLIYAFRADSEMHHVYRPWMEAVVNGDEPFAVSLQVLSSMVRIVTNPNAFVRPDTQLAAFAFADAVIRSPNCCILEPGPRHWEIFQTICRKSNARANLIQDAWFAAIAIEHGCEWITEDRDYARFPGLRWRAISAG